MKLRTLSLMDRRGDLYIRLAYKFSKQLQRDTSASTSLSKTRRRRTREMHTSMLHVCNELASVVA